MKWRAMDTAPKDRPILLLHRGEPVVAKWHDYWSAAAKRQISGFYLTVAHWEVTNPDATAWADIVLPAGGDDDGC